jgi:hypothetical protein
LPLTWANTAARIASLRALVLDTTVQFTDEPVRGSNDRAVTISSVHGVERQIAPGSGSRRGIVRGELTRVDRMPSDDIFAGRLRGETDEVFMIATSPVSDNTLWAPGSVLAVRIDYAYQDGHCIQDLAACEYRTAAIGSLEPLVIE